MLKFLLSEERSTGKKNTTIERDVGGKIGNKNKLILTSICLIHIIDPLEAFSTSGLLRYEVSSIGPFNCGILF